MNHAETSEKAFICKNITTNAEKRTSNNLLGKFYWYRLEWFHQEGFRRMPYMEAPRGADALQPSAGRHRRRNLCNEHHDHDDFLTSKIIKVSLPGAVKSTQPLRRATNQFTNQFIFIITAKNPVFIQCYRSAKPWLFRRLQSPNFTTPMLFRRTNT